MDYQKIYYDLILKRKLVPAIGYTEKHHILPRALKGTNEPYNLVTLTAREHYIAHWLLWKIHRCRVTAYAMQLMTVPGSSRHGTRYSKHRELHNTRIRKILSSVTYTVKHIQTITVASTKKKLKRKGVDKLTIRLYGLLWGNVTADYSLTYLSKKLKRGKTTIRNRLKLLENYGLYKATKIDMSEYLIELCSQ